MNGTGTRPAVHPKGRSAKLPSGLCIGPRSKQDLAHGGFPSLHLDIGCTDHLAPLLGFLGDECPERG
jgi:hypothetical protein